MKHPHPDTTGRLVDRSEFIQTASRVAAVLQSSIETTDGRDDASCVLIASPPGNRTVVWRWRGRADSETVPQFFAKNAIAMVALGGRITRLGLVDADVPLGPGMSAYSGHGSSPWRHLRDDVATALAHA